MRRADLIELSEWVLLYGQAFKHGLDHQVAVGKVGKIGRFDPLFHDLGNLSG